MKIRNILSLILLVAAIVLAFIPWEGPESRDGVREESSEVTIPSPSMAPTEIPTVPTHITTGSQQDFVAFIFAHRKLVGFTAVCILILVGIVWTKRFFDKI